MCRLETRFARINGTCNSSYLVGDHPVRRPVVSYGIDAVDGVPDQGDRLIHVIHLIHLIPSRL